MNNISKSSSSDWISLKEVLTLRPDWFFENELWIAFKDGTVEIGRYSWEQGYYPDGFDCSAYGRIGAHAVTHVKKLVKPIAPVLGYFPSN